MKCNKKNCPLVGNNENCDIRDCKWRTEDATDTDLIRRSDAIKKIAKKLEWELETDMNDKVTEWLNDIPAVEPCKDAVSREWVLNEFVAHTYDIIYDINSHEKGMSLTGIKQLIESAPSVTVEPKQGEDTVSKAWVKENMLKYGFKAPDMTVTEFIEDAPSVMSKPKQGEWIYHEDYHTCSVCGVDWVFTDGTDGSDYCPNCGAKMKGVDDESYS